jgi:hypothetical protein
MRSDAARVERIARAEDAGRVNPLGLYDLDRKIRPVGGAYRTLIRQWREILPTQSYSPGRGYDTWDSA